MESHLQKPTAVPKHTVDDLRLLNSLRFKACSTVSPDISLWAAGHRLADSIIITATIASATTIWAVEPQNGDQICRCCDLNSSRALVRPVFKYGRSLELRCLLLMKNFWSRMGGYCKK